jgi:TRAP-type uncharacterized transport system fused permease subunit
MYPVHVCFAVALVFMYYTLNRGGSAGRYFDKFLVALTLFIAVYTVLNFPRFSTRIPFVDSPTPMDIILGISLVVLLLEAGRRTVGLALVIISIIFIIYGFAGKYMPGMLAHRGLSIERFVDLQTMSPMASSESPLLFRRVGFLFISLGFFSKIRRGSLSTWPISWR